MANVKRVHNQYTKKYKNYSFYLKQIDFNDLIKSIHLSIYFFDIKYQVFTSKKMQDFISYDYIFFC